MASLPLDFITAFRTDFGSGFHSVLYRRDYRSACCLIVITRCEQLHLSGRHATISLSAKLLMGRLRCSCRAFRHPNHRRILTGTTLVNRRLNSRWCKGVKNNLLEILGPRVTSYPRLSIRLFPFTKLSTAPIGLNSA